VISAPGLATPCCATASDTLRLAFRVGLVGDGEGWLAMVQGRNLTSHTCNRSTAEQMSQQVEDRYLPCFQELRLVLSERVQATAAEERGWLSLPPPSLDPWPATGGCGPTASGAQCRARLQEVWLYGSRAMGRHRPGSDIDLTLVAPGLSHQRRLRLMGALDELLLPWSIDLSLWHELPELLRQHVARASRRVSSTHACGNASTGTAWPAQARVHTDQVKFLVSNLAFSVGNQGCSGLFPTQSFSMFLARSVSPK
jgi:predicted nucleotidyltransferase